MTDDVAVDDNDWVAVLYPQTGALRLFPSLSLAKMRVNTSAMNHHCYKSPMDLQARHDHFGLEALWRKIFEFTSDFGWPRSSKGPAPGVDESEPPDLSTENLCRELWSLIQRVGDRVNKASSANTRPKDHYRLYPDRMSALLSDEPRAKSYPRQCRIIIQAMLDLDEPYVLESALKKMMLELLASGRLKTKQDQWLVFQFYRKQIIDAGLISRGTEPDEGELDDSGPADDSQDDV